VFLNKVGDLKRALAETIVAALNMIRLEHLQKHFGRHVAVEDLSLQIEEGTLFGLLGHNGAGKSTTIGMMLGQVIPDQGQVLIDGHDVQRERALALNHVGAIFETPSFYGYLSGRRNLEIFCSYHHDRVSAKELNVAVEKVRLGSRIDDPVRVYSHGMRQRLALAQALLPQPKILILDEPSEGLDPEGIYEMRELIRELHREFGLTILICSHLLAEVEQICSKVAILRKGRLLFQGDWRQDSGPGGTLEQFYLKTVKGIEV
jgi:ABC-2 type transport system ATP-binding protein